MTISVSSSPLWRARIPSACTRNRSSSFRLLLPHGKTSRAAFATFSSSPTLRKAATASFPGAQQLSWLFAANRSGAASHLAPTATRTTSSSSQLVDYDTSTTPSGGLLHAAASGPNQLQINYPTAQQLAGFLPKPEPILQKPKKNYFTAKILLLFFLCHAVPVAAAIKYFRKRKLERIANSLMVIPDNPQAVVEEVLRVMNSSQDVFLVAPTNNSNPTSTSGPGARRSATANAIQLKRVKPLPPESQRVVPQSQETLEQLQTFSEPLTSDIATLFSHTVDVNQPKRAFRQIYFWMSLENNGMSENENETILASSSGPGPTKQAAVSSKTVSAQLPADRQGALFYPSTLRQASCTLNGRLVVVDDSELVDYYRLNYSRSSGGTSSETDRGSVVLVKFIPNQVELRAFGHVAGGYLSDDDAANVGIEDADGVEQHQKSSDAGCNAQENHVQKHGRFIENSVQLVLNTSNAGGMDSSSWELVR
ncbi:unnamed protein product [Amoebophrya sp. A120]|nr:unnamed protein product [Amoebophrya sp. A120]|eukprot:GSA120T00007318001.1